MAQQTAVDWLIEQFEKNGYIGLQAEKQAKQMEKEQIVNARVTAPLIPTSDKNDYLEEAERYYNKTYNK